MFCTFFMVLYNNIIHFTPLPISCFFRDFILLLRQLNTAHFGGYFVVLLRCKASQYHQYCYVLRLAGRQTISPIQRNI